MKPSHLWHLSVGAALCLCVALLVGCASPAKREAMIARSIPKASACHDPVAVVVEGGHETDPLFAPMVSNSEFQSALVESLRKAGIFRSVEASANAPYRLKVRLEHLDQPVAGFDMTVTLQTDWILTRPPEERVLWQQRILSPYTATMGDAFAGVTRLRVATEGAARRNIEQGLAKLAELKLDP